CGASTFRVTAKYSSTRRRRCGWRSWRSAGSCRGCGGRCPVQLVTAAPCVEPARGCDARQLAAPGRCRQLPTTPLEPAWAVGWTCRHQHKRGTAPYAAGATHRLRVCVLHQTGSTSHEETTPMTTRDDA